MSQANEIIVSQHDAPEGSFKSYTFGFISSLVLTFIAYGLVEFYERHDVSKNLLTAAILILAVIQLAVQLVCFLHLSRQAKARWNLTILAFASLIVLIVVIGSIWIMHNLNYRMTPSQVNQYLNSQDGF